jgi:hypothetical protein
MTESGNHELGEPPRPIQTPLSRATELPNAMHVRIRYCAQRALHSPRIPLAPCSMWLLMRRLVGILIIRRLSRLKSKLNDTLAF